jgi:predicted  nucleic acid-binding Zn-ribbon protein
MAYSVEVDIMQEFNWDLSGVCTELVMYRDQVDDLEDQIEELKDRIVDLENQVKDLEEK